MIHFVGAGSGAADLITVRGKKLLEEADVIIYAGSLVNPELLSYKKDGCAVHNSATMTLEEVIAVMLEAEQNGLTTVRLHTGDPCIYGAIREQMQWLDAVGIPYEVVPGVSSAFAASAALKKELTVPEVTQTVILTRQAGRTPVPERESLARLAAVQATMCIFLSVALIERVVADLLAGGYPVDTPVAGSMAISAPLRSPKACSAMRCSSASTVNVRLLPATGAVRARVRTARPPASTSTCSKPVSPCNLNS